MSKRSAFEAGIEKRQHVKQADASGQIAVSMDVRRALMAKVHSGEITLAEAQQQLKKIQSGAAAKGLMTREQAYNEG